MIAMVDWFLETGLYLLGVAVVPLVGLLLVCWGLWGDRSKGRPRCPKCWYDMRGSLPKLECPECGHAVRQERQLHRNHRRWFHIVLGALLLSCSYPVILVSGWYRERSIIQTFAISVGTSHVDNVSCRVRIGPTWLIGSLPDTLARFSERVERVVVRTDEAIAACRRLPHLRELHVVSSGVTDAGLAHVKELPRLEELLVVNAQVTAEGLNHLKRMPQLRKLVLTRMQLTRESLACIGQLDQLEDLVFYMSTANDSDLIHLNNLRQLRVLRLSDTPVTDAGLVHLETLAQLEEVALRDTAVTDAGLVHLEGLSQLRLLFLDDTQVTDAGVAKLKQALPKLEVHR